MMAKKKKTKNLIGIDKVEVLGHTFKVIETDDVNELISNNVMCYGLCKFLEQEIVISKRQSIQSMKQVFYHELLHAIDYLMHNEETKYDEECVNVLARGLLTVRIN